MRALISTSDRTGLPEFARILHLNNTEILSTGQTGAFLTSSGIPVTLVSEITGFPEILDGRVKTLHPKIHGGLLAKRYRWGDEITHDDANYGRKVGKPTVAGSYPANGYGLYDMGGNVHEWCQDRYYEEKKKRVFIKLWIICNPFTISIF